MESLNIHELRVYVQKSEANLYPKNTFFLYRSNAFKAIKRLVQLGAAIPVYSCLTGLQRMDIIEQLAWTSESRGDGYKPGTPLLLVSMNPSKKQYRYQSLTTPSLFVNKVYPQDKELQEQLAAHFRKPCWETHKACAKRIAKLSYKNKLCYH